MALSGSIGNTFKSGWRLELDWTATQNITNNSSLITSKLYLVSLTGWATIRSSSTNGLRTIIDGTTYTGSFNPTLNGNQRKLIQTSSKTVTHGADGTKSFTIGGSADLKVTLSGTYFGTVNLPTQSFNLNTIPRRSTLSSSPSFNLGTNVPVKINRASSSFTHTIKIYVNNTLIVAETGVGSSWTFVPTNSQRNTMYNLTPNSNTATTKITVATYSGGSLLGLHEETGVGRIIGGKPIFTNFTFTDKNTTLRDKIGTSDIMVQSLSKLQAEVSYSNRATAVKGASIIKYIATIGNVTQTRDFLPSGNHIFDINELNTSGLIPLTIRAVDSRGNSAEVVKRINYLPYKEPLLTATAKRLNGFENQTKLNINGLFSPLTISGVNKNYIKTINYKAFPKGSSGSFSSVSGVTYTGNRFKVPDISLNLDNTKIWIIEIRVNDNLQPGYTYQTLEIRPGVPPWYFEGEGNLRIKGGLVQVGSEKIIANDGKSVDRYTPLTGTYSELNAFKMGTNGTGGATNFPTKYGSWAYFQGTTYTGNDTNGDFILWKSRSSSENKLYIGVVKDGQATDFQPVITIVEEGSNSDGTFIKYSDGTMVCEHYMFIQVVVNQAWGSLYHSNILNWNYPASFVGRPYASASDNITSEMVFQIPLTTRSTNYEFRFGSPVTLASRQRQMSMYAFGRWK